jgi:acyl carrier protein
MDDIMQKIGEILDEMGISLEGVGLEATLTEDMGMDSLMLVDFAHEIEVKFDVIVPDDALMANMTLQQVADKIKELKEA